jgi:hypothetical protein
MGAEVTDNTAAQGRKTTMNTPNDSGFQAPTANHECPPTPWAPPVRPPALPGQTRLAHGFDSEYTAIPGALTAHVLLERLLKTPASVAYELTCGRRLQASVGLVVIAALCFLGYGFIIGTFSFGEQLLLVPLKLMVGVVFAAVICLPSLYIFSSFSGGRQSLGDTVGLFILGLALWSILLVGFAPIAWLFSQSTGTVAFMGLLHLLFWVAAAYFGLNLMNTALEHLNGHRLGILRVWGVIFLVVTMQVATLFRPLIGKAAPLQLNEKKFFLAHWADCINGRGNGRK